MSRFAGKAWGAAFGLALCAQSGAQLKTTVYATGFTMPVAIIQDPTSSTRQFVVQQRGLIRCVINGVVQATPAIDLTGTVSTAGSEKGLLGLAFDPNYATNRIAYVYYTTGNVSTSTTSWIAKIVRSPIDPNVFTAGVDPIFTLAQPFSNHNGGTIKFGADGFLYVGLGDGGSGGDPGDRAQNLTNLLGKMLRIDPSMDAFPADPNKDYAIPPGQPFSGTWGTLAPEVWALGLRNPWKWSFDDPTKLGTGGLLIADVGQDAWEEINYAPPGVQARNYGWRRKEGYVFFTTTSGPNTDYRDPFWVYSHGTGVSITGGHRYRGLMLGDYFGRYFFSDFGFSVTFSAQMNFNAQGEALNASAADIIDHTADMGGGFNGISSIDADAQGELFFVDYSGGRVLRLEPENRAWATDIGFKAAEQMAGQIRSLSAPDDLALVYIADFSTDSFDGDAGVLLAGYTHNRTTVSTVQVTARLKTNQPTGHSAQIRLRNWSTKRLDTVQTVNLTTAYQNFSTPSVAAANYVRSSDKRIEVAITGSASLTLVDPVTTFVDQIKVNVN